MKDLVPKKKKKKEKEIKKRMLKYQINTFFFV